METTPLVRDGIMYVTGTSNHAWAIDLKTGKQIWHYSKTPKKPLDLCCGEVNRGFAMQGDRLFKVNIEDTLVALDRVTGKVLWEVELGDYRKGYSGTVAPLVIKNLVVVGTAGAEFGIRGFVDAYDTATGKRVWRFYTIPLAGEPGGDTWGPATEHRVGGSTWITGTYDPELNLIYWGTGNPGPDMNGDVRPGDNLYTCSLVALDADTGKAEMAFSIHAARRPRLGRHRRSGPGRSENQRRDAQGRGAGESQRPLLRARPHQRQAAVRQALHRSELDQGVHRGGPARAAPGSGAQRGRARRPVPVSAAGTTGMRPPTVRAPDFTTSAPTDGCHMFYRTEQQFVEGQWYQLSTVDWVKGESNKKSVVAVDTATGQVKWRRELEANPSGGMLSTASDLVFYGDSAGYLVALDARTGETYGIFRPARRSQRRPSLMSSKASNTSAWRRGIWCSPSRYSKFGLFAAVVAASRNQATSARQTTKDDGLPHGRHGRSMGWTR